MEFQIPNFQLAATELFVAAGSLVLLLLSIFSRGQAARDWAYRLTILIFLGAFFVNLITVSGEIGTTFSGMYRDDLFGDFLKLVVSIIMAVAVCYGRRYMADRELDSPEFFLLVVFLGLGMMVLISAGNLLSLYLGLELLSLASYGMVAINRDSGRSTEAAMKYFVLGALASGLLLYGISMLYGATGTLEIFGVARGIYDGTADRSLLLFGLAFLVAGVAFKLGVVPFHMWIPDVYQGAPTAVSLLIATAPKLAAYTMAFRLLAVGMWGFAEQWQHMLMFLAVASIVLGNLAAIAQTNLKRLLAYSGISHMGFVLLGMVSGVVDGDRQGVFGAYSSAMFYSIIYTLTTLAAFGLILVLSRAGYESEEIDDLRGLNERSPWWAAMMGIVMFSMAGIPFFVGFFAKFAVLQAVVQAGYIWLAVLAVVMSLIGAYYYLRVVKVMYFDRPQSEYYPISASISMKVVLSVNALAIAVLGLMPGWLLRSCQVILQHSIWSQVG